MGRREGWTERRDAWTVAELQILYDRLTDPAYFETVRPLLPSRTPKAIKKRMAMLRDAAGIDVRACSYGMESSHHRRLQA